MKTKLATRIFVVGVMIQFGFPVDVAVAGAGKTRRQLPPALPESKPKRRLPPAYDDRHTEARAPLECKNCSVAKRRNHYREVMRVAGQGGMSYRTRGKAFGAACRKHFIDGNGNLGSVGRQVANLVSSDAYRASFLDGNSLKAVCPKFSPSWSREKQAQAWVWFWMVLANEESTCDPNKYHATHFKNGKRLNPKPGWGLFAAELRYEHRHFRGKMCRGNIYSADEQVKCAVHTMAATQLAKGRGLLWSGSYWGPLRRYDRQIVPNMRGFEACY